MVRTGSLGKIEVPHNEPAIDKTIDLSFRKKYKPCSTIDRLLGASTIGGGGGGDAGEVGRAFGDYFDTKQ